MIFAVISDVVWTAIIGGVVTLMLAWMNMKLGAIAKTGEKTHDALNSGLGLLLNRHKDATRRLAELPDAPEADIDAAVIAKEASDEHERVQAIVDSKETKS